MKTVQTYTTSSGEKLFYTGKPNFALLDTLVLGPGDVWHSSLDHGFKDCFPELVYQTSVFWWFLNDFTDVNQAVNWRVDSAHFVVRAEVWEQLNGFDSSYDCDVMAGLDFGLRLLRYHGGIPMYIKGMFNYEPVQVDISIADRYRFFAKHFKKRHSLYMLWRQGVFNLFYEYSAYLSAKNTKPYKAGLLKLKPLQPLQGNPKVSVVIPTMKRQAYTEMLLNDYKQQTYPVYEVVIVDATPITERNAKYYQQENFDFKLNVKWQTTKGSCRARNEAIALCSGDYIIFADDDVRIMPDFVEKHIRLLQTYGVKACNGLDVMATNINQDLTDLNQRLEAMGDDRWKIGVSHMFSNANSIVEMGLVKQLIGNDINFDGGYGEDTDFGLRILKAGEILLHNPYAPNLHLKPPQGGYRFWGESARLMGKQRRTQPWELDAPVKWIRPVPSPTISYGILKHFKPQQIKEWRKKYMFMYLFKGSKLGFLKRLLNLPFKQLQFNRSLFYAKKLMKLGVRY